MKKRKRKSDRPVDLGDLPVRSRKAAVTKGGTLKAGGSPLQAGTTVTPAAPATTSFVPTNQKPNQTIQIASTILKSMADVETLAPKSGM